MAASLDELYNIVHQESIMKTSIIGYPRVGSLRELKFTTEQGDVIRPLYDVHRQRYVVYWDLKEK